MKTRNWTIRKAEALLLGACSTFWFSSCQDSGVAAHTDESSSSTVGSSFAASSSHTALSSSSSMSIEPQPLYGVIYSEPTLQSSSAQASSSSVLCPESSSSAVASSSSTASSSSLGEVVALYGVYSPINQTPCP